MIYLGPSSRPKYKLKMPIFVRGFQNIFPGEKLRAVSGVMIAQARRRLRCSSKIRFVPLKSIREGILHRAELLSAALRVTLFPLLLQEAGDNNQFCWRNLFSCINLLRILNKLTKWKHSRTMVRRRNTFPPANSTYFYNPRALCSSFGIQ